MDIVQKTESELFPVGTRAYQSEVCFPLLHGNGQRKCAEQGEQILCRERELLHYTSCRNFLLVAWAARVILSLSLFLSLYLKIGP